MHPPSTSRPSHERRRRDATANWRRSARLAERGHHRRAAGLAAEHVEEFPLDAESLADVVGWFEDGQPR